MTVLQDLNDDLGFHVTRAAGGSQVATSARMLPKTNKMPSALCLLLSIAGPSVSYSGLVNYFDLRQAACHMGNIGTNATKAVTEGLRLRRDK